MQFHPDRNPGDDGCEHKFKEISEAYEVLKDEQKRAAYDRFGHAAFENGGGRAAPTASVSISPRRSPISSTICSASSWAARRGQRRQNRGGDLRYNLEITLEEAFNGKHDAIARQRRGGLRRLQRHAARKRAPSPSNCPTCQGAGKVRAQQGFFTIERTCPALPRRRPVHRAIPCKRCRGHGHVQKEKTLPVTIPAGVEEGTRIRLAGEGQAGLNGGPAGDLYIFLSVAAASRSSSATATIFIAARRCRSSRRRWADRSKCRPSTAASRSSIPEGTQIGHQFRVRGKGMPVMRGGGMAGDMYIEVAVETPVKLTKKQKEHAAHLREGRRRRLPSRNGRLLRPGQGILESERGRVGASLFSQKFPLPLKPSWPANAGHPGDQREAVEKISAREKPGISKL